MSDQNQLIDQNGLRLYLTQEERAAFMNAAKDADRPLRTFCGVLHYTGCRITEALELTVKSIDLDAETITFRTLKKRENKIVYRAVPVPPDFLDIFDAYHGIREARKEWSRRQNERLWLWHRATAWRYIKQIMIDAGISEGAHRTAKGLRHGYGIAAISKGVPLNMLQQFMGHSKMENTAIYANAMGEEANKIAARMWE